MALDVNVLANALATVDIELIQQTYAINGATLDPLTETNIRQRAQLYAQAIHTWILTATVTTTVNTNLNTLHPSGTINVTGTALAQTNPAPVVGGGTGSGTGVGSIS